jgi:hypothetical protein
MHLCTFQIAGNRHAPGSLDFIEAGQTPIIYWEQENEFDDKAMMVQDPGGCKLGYIPKPLNAAVWALLKMGFTLEFGFEEDARGLVAINAIGYSEGLLEELIPEGSTH